MKTYILVIVLLVSSFLLFSQNNMEKVKLRNVEYAVSINTPLFGSDRYQMFLIPIEYIFKKNTSSKTSVGFFIGHIFTKEFVPFVYCGGIEISKLYPLNKKKQLYFEIGSGISYLDLLSIQGKIGGRFELGNHILLKLSYSPFLGIGYFTGTKPFYGPKHFLAVSVGYRFHFK